MRRPLHPLVAVVAALLAAHACLGAEPPRLVLFITVDQFRGDVLRRYADAFGEGGFRHLLDNGLHYTNAHYRHSTTFTAGATLRNAASNKIVSAISGPRFSVIT